MQLGLGGHSRLLTWEGSDASLESVLFVTHLDVVPVTQVVEAWGKARAPFLVPALSQKAPAGSLSLCADLAIKCRLTAFAGLLNCCSLANLNLRPQGTEQDWVHPPFSGRNADG